MEVSSHFIEKIGPSGETYKLHVKVFQPKMPPNKEHRPLIFIHGAIEDGKIFYSTSGKGLAPYLCQKGFPCYVFDLRARGESTPPLGEAQEFNQFDILDQDFPGMVKFVQDHAQTQDFSFITHSWGGVLVNSFLLKSPEYIESCKKNVHISTKRRVGVFNWQRLFYIDLMWFLVGSMISLIKGYLPANYYGPGGESRGTLKDSQKWVYSARWIDSKNNLDYNALANKIPLPETLYLTGARDMCLGHIEDVKRFALESKHSPRDILFLSKEGGHLENYDHISILTSPHAPQDHFPIIAKFLIS